MDKKNVVKPLDVPKRLAELGVDEELLVTAAMQGLAAWAGCTAHHPPLYPGLSAWAETVKALRDQLVLRSWTHSDAGTLSLVINKDDSIAIAVATGNEFTGDEAHEPCTKSGKGPRTEEAVVVNQLQLFPEMSSILKPVSFEPARTRKTWWLLVHRDMIAQELKCELSHPINMADDGRIDGWAERIILRSTSFGDNDIVLRDSNSNGPQGNAVDVDVEIKRRA